MSRLAPLLLIPIFQWDSNYLHVNLNLTQSCWYGLKGTLISLIFILFSYTPEISDWSLGWKINFLSDSP